MSFDGSIYATGRSLLDASANLLGYLAWQDVFEAGLNFSLPLEKISDGGSLVFVPYDNSVDIFDVNHGALLHRLTLNDRIPKVTDAMAIGANGETIYLITSAGLTVVQPAHAPLAIGSLVPAAGSSGTTVTIHGSGFQTGTSVTVGGLVAPTTLVDSNTLHLTMPGVPAGAQQVIVTNPSGDSYTLDNAFLAQ